jgi:hypothetical protein
MDNTLRFRFSILFNRRKVKYLMNMLRTLATRMYSIRLAQLQVESENKYRQVYWRSVLFG